MVGLSCTVWSQLSLFTAKSEAKYKELSKCHFSPFHVCLRA